jgi:Tat protein secretion system quality control protein TatD with DNase activity
MNKFSQFNIKLPDKGFEGEKIKMSRILNREIVVHAFRIEDSKVQAFKEKGTGKCLHMQISFNGDLHVVFTSSTGLIETISQIPLDKFPFSTTIIEENDRYKFT